MGGLTLSSRDLENLGAYFQALGFPSRLQLLNLLQVPRTAQEIRLPPTRVDRQARDDRPVSRQALAGHLRRLLAIGLVEASPGRRRGRRVTEYTVSHARLFALVEEMRRLCLIRPASTVTAVQDPGPEGPTVPEPGPGLVMANGPLEGRTFPLAGRGPWTIGRSPTCDVCLEHDPFVSKRNTVVRRTGPEWKAQALTDSRNGTLLNWRPMTAGGEAALRNGDVLRVGRTLLVLRGV